METDIAGCGGMELKRDPKSGAHKGYLETHMEDRYISEFFLSLLYSLLSSDAVHERFKTYFVITLTLSCSYGFTFTPIMSSVEAVYINFGL